MVKRAARGDTLIHDRAGIHSRQPHPWTLAVSHCVIGSLNIPILDGGTRSRGKNDLSKSAQLGPSRAQHTRGALEIFSQSYFSDLGKQGGS